MKSRSTKIYITLTIVWTIIIFSFSLQPADTSSQVSSGFGRWLIEVFAPNFIDEFESMSEEQLAYIHFLLRKCAHFTEYFILGALVLLSQRHAGIRRKIFTGLVICMLVASVDETIQLFVSGRSGQISDVLLDTAGAAVGSLVVRRISRG
ncbi:MAG: VanZ family protein [Lachnospiraceae bacterium]|nr:VanZ family protein [Lachnospiraceae bacterium]